MNFRNKRKIVVGSKILIKHEPFTVKEIDEPWALISPSNKKSGGWGVVLLSDVEKKQRGEIVWMAFLLRSDYTLAGIDSLLTTSEPNNSALKWFVILRSHK